MIRGKGALLLSLVLGIAAAAMMSIYLNTREGELLQLSQMKDVLVTTQDVLPGIPVTAAMVQRIQVPGRYVQPRALADLREVVGRVTDVPVPGGSQMLGTYLQDGGRVGLAFEVPRGQRAITIAVGDVTGVGGLVRPGNFVDIFGTFEYGRPNGTQGGRTQFTDERTETRVLLQNISVVAVERELNQQSPQTSSGSGGLLLTSSKVQNSANTREIRNVTVLVGPREAQQLVLAQQVGTLTLALRSTVDTGQVGNLGALDPLGLLDAKVPVKSRARPSWQEIRGGNTAFAF